MVSGQRFRIRDIQSGAADDAFAERLVERLGVHYRSPRDVDKRRRGLHLPQRGGVYQVPRFRGQRTGQHHVVRLLEQLVKRNVANAEFRFAIHVPTSISVQHVHVESSCPPSDLPTDVA